MNSPKTRKTTVKPVDKPWLSIVIPVYNEEANLPELLGRCLDVGEKIGRPYEIILVDDGSRDSSVDIIRAAVKDNDSKIVGIFLNRNYGQHSAVMAGFEHASGSVIVTDRKSVV